jgi:hypothetical protein
MLPDLMVALKFLTENQITSRLIFDLEFDIFVVFLIDKRRHENHSTLFFSSVIILLYNARGFHIVAGEEIEDYFGFADVSKRCVKRSLNTPRVESLTCLLKTATSSLKESDEHTSPPATPGSRGVQVASSHFSNINANSGKSGCLEGRKQKKIIKSYKQQKAIVSSKRFSRRIN